MDRKTAIDTVLVHAGEPLHDGAAVPPITRSTVNRTVGTPGYDAIRYPRLSNLLNHNVLAAKLAALEGTQAAVVTASGMAAISTTLLALLSAGDHLMAQGTLYGGTLTLLADDLARLGIAVSFVDADDPESWRSALRSNTRAFYVETLSNPLLTVPDLPGVAAFARKHGLTAIIDNTFATPVNFRPVEHGFDLVLHSATKYLNGHSDVVAGAVCGSAELVGRIHTKLNHLGGSLDPGACYLLHRGLKTLALRVRHQNASARRIAQALSRHPRVVAVHYPGLKTHPQHKRAADLLDGFGGMMSFELQGSAADAQAVAEGGEIFLCAPSLGGPESLMTRPAVTSHASLTPDQRRAAGVSDTLVRLSVGIEDANDLVLDLMNALERRAE